MRRYLVLLGLAFARPLQAQFHFTHRDTLPQKVVQRALDGYNHHDVVAIEAEYLPTYLYQNLSDSAGPRLTSRVDMRDSLVVVFQPTNDAHLTLSKRVLTGPIVPDVFVAKGIGRKEEHGRLLEVLHGEIGR